MVRLRSSRWYSSEGQHRSRKVVHSSASGTRRVLSLCMLLALVIVLMQKVSDPKHVSHVFRMLGVPLSGTGATENSNPTSATGGNSPVAAASLSAVQASADKSPWSVACNDLVPRLMQPASDDLINELSLRWFGNASSPGASSLPGDSEDDLGKDQDDRDQDDKDQDDNDSNAFDAWYPASLLTLQQLQAELNDRLTQVGNEEQAGLLAWQNLLERFTAHWKASWEVDAPSPSNAANAADAELVMKAAGEEVEFQQAISSYLDHRLLQRMRDASPWSKGETVAFYRLLQRAKQMSSQSVTADPPLLETLQLQAESPRYRGQPIRFRGSVRRIERVERQRPELGIDGYWVMWLRGEDMSDQPVAVYTTHALAKQMLRTVSSDQYPDVDILGLGGKKLAYSAASGVEVAPTIFAASMFQVLDTQLATSGKSAEQLGSEAQWALTVGALAAGIFLLPILASWRRRLARRPPQRSIATKALLLLAVSSSVYALANTARCFAAPAPAEPQVLGQQAADITPPWAKPANGNSPSELLQQQLTLSLTAAFPSQINGYVGGEVGRFPDEALKLAFQLRKLGRQVDLATLDTIDLPEVGLRLVPKEVTGLVRLAMPIALSEDQQLWFQATDESQLFRLQIETPSTAGGQLLTAFVERVPSRWLTSKQLLQPIVVRGMAAYAASDDGSAESSSPMCLFAAHARWQLPQSGTQSEVQAASAWQPGLPLHHERLLSAGWDLGLLDDIQLRQQQPLEAVDVQPFYTLMRTAAAMPAAIPAAGREREGQGDGRLVTDSLFEVLKSPASHTGATVEWPIRLVRGTKVEVEDGRTEQLLGADHYYQFDGFADIGRNVVNFRSGVESDSEVVPFQGEFPISLVARDCPPAFKPPDGASVSNWDIGRAATAAGLFYRLWSYESEMMTKLKPTARQVAPLIIVQTLEPRETKPQRSDDVGWFGYALTVVMVIISGGILWLARPQRRMKQNRPV